MKIEIIERHSYTELQRDVNYILSQHDASEILDIKYSGSGNHPSYSRDYYSVMIIYK